MRVEQAMRAVRATAKRRARRLADRVILPYVSPIAPAPTAFSAPVEPDTAPAPGLVPITPSDFFHSVLHELRTVELKRIPKGARRVVSVGASGRWYFDWFTNSYGSVDEHIGIEAYLQRPDDLPSNVTWIPSTADDFGSIESSSVDLVFAGQTSEHLWADEIRGFLTEAHRCLKTNGLLVLDSPNRLVTEHLRWSHGGHTIEMSPAEITELLTLAGFQITSLTGLWSCRLDGDALQLEDGLDDPVMLTRRMTMDGNAEPDDGFVWWAVATKSDRAPLAAELEARLEALFEQHWAVRVSRGMWPGPGSTSLAIKAGTSGSFSESLPFPLRGGRWGISVTATEGSLDALTDLRVEIVAPGGQIAHTFTPEGATGSDRGLSWTFAHPSFEEAFSLRLSAGAVLADVALAMPVQLVPLPPVIDDPSEVETHRSPFRMNLTTTEFLEHRRAGLLPFDRNAEFALDATSILDITIDPHSEAYAAQVLASWSSLTGRTSYDPSTDEAFPLDTADYLASPFPYCSQNRTEIAQYLGAVATAIGVLGVDPPARVLEFGSGWGHLSLALAASGYETTAIDLNLASVELLRRRAQALGVPLEVVRSTFLDYEIAQPADVIVFFEAFHHCADPFRLLDKCIDGLAPDGRIVFIAEAVYEGFYAPWGIRLDGSAITMTAQEGWLELGFDRDFFWTELLDRGLRISYESRPDLGAYGTFLVAQRWNGQIEPWRTLLPTLEEASWISIDTPGGNRRLSSALSRLTLPSGPSTEALVRLRNVGIDLIDVRLTATGSRQDYRDVTIAPSQCITCALPLPQGHRTIEVHSQLTSAPRLAAGRIGVSVEAIDIARPLAAMPFS